MGKIHEHELSAELREYLHRMDRLAELAESDGYVVRMLSVYTKSIPTGPAPHKICDLADYKEHREELAQGRFLSMVEERAREGCRMVAFDTPNGASWLCCYDTQGRDAGGLPVEAFANDRWMSDLRGYADWPGPVEEVSHADVTDDPAEMLSGYDWWAAYPVQQLVPVEGLREVMNGDRTDALREALEGLISAMRSSEWCCDCDGEGCTDMSCPVPGAMERAQEALAR